MQFFEMNGLMLSVTIKQHKIQNPRRHDLCYLAWIYVYSSGKSSLRSRTSRGWVRISITVRHSTTFFDKGESNSTRILFCSVTHYSWYMSSISAGIDTLFYKNDPHFRIFEELTCSHKLHELPDLLWPQRFLLLKPFHKRQVQNQKAYHSWGLRFPTYHICYVLGLCHIQHWLNQCPKRH